MTTTVENIFKVNGVIDTSKTVVQNLQELCAASGCWLSYDIAQGKWAVAINTTGSSIASFNDSNIIGGINISSTGLTELYNSVEIEYPHKDIKDRKDYITFSIADGSRYPNEPDNVLELQTDLVNDPIQAAYIASRELKQSRVDKVIEFRTDFSKLGLKAGDLIDITNTPYGYSSKVFRIVSITEDDADDGVLSLSIQALEYDADVYSTAGLERDERFTDTGIITKDKNTATKTSDGTGTANDLTNALIASGLAAGGIGLINTFLSRMTGDLSKNGVPGIAVGTIGVSKSTILDTYQGWIDDGYPDPFLNPFKVTFPVVADNIYGSIPAYFMEFRCEVPVGSWKYTSGGTKTIGAYIPTIISVYYNSVDNFATSSFVTEKTADWQTPVVNFQFAQAALGFWYIAYSPTITYDLSLTSSNQIIPTAYDAIQDNFLGSGVSITGVIINRKS